MTETTKEYVTLRLGGQMLGIPVLSVHDVLNEQRLTPVPLAPSWVAGLLNLRGRIVTSVDLRARLGLPPRDFDESDRSKSMSIVVELNEEPYSLLIDEIGEVLRLSDDAFEKNPITLEPMWADVSQGVYRLENELLVILDVDRLLSFGDAAMAA